MAKSFKTAATPTRPAAASEAEKVLRFVTHGQKAPEAAAQALEQEPTARLSLDIPQSLHTRYKAACARSRLKMAGDITAFIERRTAELEEKST